MTQKKMLCARAKMQKTLVVLVACFFTLQLYAQSNITLRLEKANLVEFFKAIENKSNLRFSYLNQNIDNLKDITLNASNEADETLIKRVLSTKGYTYKRTGNTIAVLKAEKSAVQGSKKIIGLVTDEKGDPIIGASIMLKGSSTGTITDFNGSFSIEADTQDVLQISYIGYQRLEQKVGNASQLSVKLIEDTKSLDEVVVVGYGVQKKRDVIGSVATVKSADLNKSGSLSVYNNLQGKASGLNITTSAAGSKILVRGVHSINSGNDPLWVVDGIPSFPPNSDEIESVEILKDASATAIYGSRGSNGVIIVTTKKGKEGKTDLSLNVHSGVSLITKTDADMGYSTNSLWFDIMDVATGNSNVSAFDPMTILNEDSRYKTTDISADQARLVRDNWFQAVTRPANYVNAGLSLSTGSKNGSTYMNANYRKSEGNTLNKDNQEISFRINSDYKVNDIITLGGKVNVNRNEQNFDGGSTFRMAPWRPLYNTLDPERTGYWNPHGNPLTNIDPKYRQMRYDNIRILGGLYTEIALPFVKGLAIRSEYNMNLGINNSTDWQSALVTPVTVSEAGSRATEQSLMGQKNNVNSYFKYTNSFGKHSVSGVAGVEGEREDGYYRLASGRNLTTEYPQLGSTPGERTEAQGGFQYESYLLSVFGRADYKFGDKYLAGVSFRRDGSSLFAPEYRWGTFTAYSTGWILSEEKFMKTLKWVNMLKLRGSMGQTGNKSIPQNKNLTTFNTDKNYGYGEEAILSGGKKPATIGNSSLSWETTSSYDIGLDYGLLNNKLSGSIAYYFQDVNGLVLAASVPKSTGLSGNQEIWGNMGRIYNSGFEFNISGTLVNKKDFGWTIDFNVSTSANKVVKLTTELDEKGIPIYHDGNKVVGLVSKTGGMVREYYMPEYAGVDSEYGVEMIYELDKTAFKETGKTVRTGRLIPATQGNMQNNRFILENKTITPTYYGGITNTVRYKQLDLNFLFSFSGGNYIYDHEMSVMSTPGRGKSGLINDLIENSWQKPGDNANYPRLVYNYAQPVDWDPEAINPTSPTGKGDWILSSNGNYSIEDGSHTKYLFKGDFAKLKHVEIGYTIPELTLKKIGLKSFRAYIAADNLYTLTKYPGWDPESGYVRGGVVGLQSYTMNPFLVTATVFAGLQLKF